LNKIKKKRANFSLNRILKQKQRLLVLQKQKRGILKSKNESPLQINLGQKNKRSDTAELHCSQEK